MLGKGHRVKGFTRRADSPAAKELERLGAELAIGNFDDPDSIKRAAAGRDIAGFAALVLENRDKFLGKRIDIASDELTFSSVAEILSTLLGREIQYVELPVDAIREQNEDFAIMYEWFDKVGYSVDIDAQHRDYPEVGWHTYEEWAKAQDWSIPTAA